MNSDLHNPGVTLAQIITAEQAEQKAESMKRFADEMQSLATQYGVKLLGAVLFLVAAWFVAGWAARLARRGMDRAKIDLTLSKFIANAARWVVLILAGIACLGIFGIQTASFAAVIGAAGLAIGLAFQGTLSNLAAGAMLLIFRPFRIGDSVVVAGQSGVVDGIELFTTKLDTADNRRIILPNSAIFGTIIENQSHHPVRRGTINLIVPFDTSLDRVRDTLKQAAGAVPGQFSGKPAEVALTKLGTTGIEWEVRVWATKETLGAVYERACEDVKRGLDGAGIPLVTAPHSRTDSR